MLSAEQNELLTRVGPGTAAGALLRRYWQPVALIEELAGKRPVKAIRIFGQDFVLFRDTEHRYGLFDRHCPHRGADLAFGRLEDGGLRCLFHGWLFDVTGQCLETPAEPVGSTICKHIRHKAYPVVAQSGVLFGYLGEGSPPAFPAFDCFVAPEQYTFAFKGLIDCNWLQAVEVGIDPAHASYLHRFATDEESDRAYGKQFRGHSADSGMPITKRSGPKNLDSPVSVISARMGDGIARMSGDNDGKKTEKESRGRVQGKGGTGGDSWRQDAGRDRRAVRGAPAPGDAMEKAAA